MMGKGNENRDNNSTYHTIINQNRTHTSRNYYKKVNWVEIKEKALIARS